MTAPFPPRKQEEWRYADLDALQPVWEQSNEPERIAILPGQSLEQAWLPGGDAVEVRRVAISLGAGARMRLFVLNTAEQYGRIDLEVSLAEGAEFELFAANIGTGLSTNEIVTIVRHLEPNGRSRQTVRSVLGGKAVGTYLGKIEVARAETDRNPANFDRIAARKPSLLEALSGQDRDPLGLARLLPDGLQSVEIGVAPLFLLAAREGRSHARLRCINARRRRSRRRCRSGAISP